MKQDEDLSGGRLLPKHKALVLADFRRTLGKADQQDTVGLCDTGSRPRRVDRGIWIDTLATSNNVRSEIKCKSASTLRKKLEYVIAITDKLWIWFVHHG